MKRLVGVKDKYFTLLKCFSSFLGEILQAPMLGLVLLIVTCVLFDFAAQACFNPCESLIYDTCKGTSQESSCFFVYSFMTSFGKVKTLENEYPFVVF